MEGSGDWIMLCCMCPGPLFLFALILSSFMPRTKSIGYRYSLPPKERQVVDAQEVFEAQIDDEM